MHYLDYNEKINHGTPGFPIAYYHVNERHPRYNMPFHWHREMELIRILSGSMRLFLDSRELCVQAGDLILIDGGTIHGGIPCDCDYECAVFRPDALLSHPDACRPYLNLLSRQQIRLYNYFHAGQPRTDRLLAGTDRLFQALRYPHAGSELLTFGALYEIFGCLFEEEFYEQLPEDASPGHNCSARFRKADQLKPVLEYIDANYAGPITLEELSRLAGMSPKYFCRYFRTVIHRTPMDYLNYYRIEHSCRLLNATELPVTEIAYRCGFNDSSYFVKTFKKYMGITPRQYALRQPDAPS